MITLSTSKPVSPFGRDLKGTFAALQSLLRTKAIDFTLRLATIPFRSRRNNIDLIRGALGMNCSSNTQKICSLLIEQQRLPASFEKIVCNIYLPLAQIIIDKKQHQPLLVNINGAQGTGKSTLTSFLKTIIESEFGCETAELSLDDFYYTRSERHKIAMQVHPLFITRGVPGTHDTGLIENVLDALINRRFCRAPRFDKAGDERCVESEWTDYKRPVDVILFEGWCNGSPVQSQAELASPVNELEADEDADGIWRQHANEQLKYYHQHIFKHADLNIMLNAIDFERIYQWRRLQEKKLEQSSSAIRQHIMNDAELKRFIQHYERISRHTLSHLPAVADIVLPVAADHSITDIIQHRD
jgi:D-glycerate 3-kinase